VPLIAGTKLIGGIGVSGGTGQQDGIVANAAAASLAEILASQTGIVAVKT
jgi:uncharacterized protein GlcG (DUF336 family)